MNFSIDLLEFLHIESFAPCLQKPVDLRVAVAEVIVLVLAHLAGMKKLEYVPRNRVIIPLSDIGIELMVYFSKPVVLIPLPFRRKFFQTGLFNTHHQVRAFPLGFFVKTVPSQFFNFLGKFEFNGSYFPDGFRYS